MTDDVRRRIGSLLVLMVFAVPLAAYVAVYFACKAIQAGTEGGRWQT